MTPAETFAAIPGFGSSDASLTSLPGRAADNWLVETPGGRWVMRVPRLAEARHAEGQMGTRWRLAAEKANLAAPLVYVNADTGLSLSVYCEGTVWSKQDFRDPENLTLLASRLSGIQRLPPCDGQLDLLAAGSSYLEAAPGCADIFARLVTLDSYQQREPFSPVLAHGDLLPENCVRGENLTFLDWDFVTMTSPWFDVATVVFHHGLDASLTRHFLTHWLGHEPGPADYEQLALWGGIYDCLLLFWAAGETGSSSHADLQVVNAARRRFTAFTG